MVARSLEQEHPILSRVESRPVVRTKGTGVSVDLLTGNPASSTAVGFLVKGRRPKRRQEHGGPIACLIGVSLGSLGDSAEKPQTGRCEMWLSDLSPFETYLVALPAVMFGSILFLAGIILLLQPQNKNDAETLEEIRKALEIAGAEFNGAPTEEGTLAHQEPAR